MTSPVIPRLSLDSTIEHRLLVNFAADPAVAARLVPAPFEPEFVDGAAILGLCAVRLRSPRPAGLPAIPMRADGTAHRIAVVHRETGKRAVWVPLRHTSSRIAAITGGRLVAGVQHPGRFVVRSAPGAVSVRVQAPDLDVRVTVEPTDALVSRRFADMDAISAFFHDAPVAYSRNRSGDAAEGLRLHTTGWSIGPARLVEFHSSFLDALPAGSLELDSVLLMRGVPALWSTAPLVPLERQVVAA